VILVISRERKDFKRKKRFQEKEKISRERKDFKRKKSQPYHRCIIPGKEHHSTRLRHSKERRILQLGTNFLSDML
jgi:hypothetical protein